MRFPHRPAAAVVAFGVTLAALAFGLSFASASKPAAANPVTFHQVVAGLAGDSASGFGQPSTASTATSTPTPPSGSCTSGHASLRAFADAGAAGVSRDPQPATVGDLRQLARPATIPTSATRTAPLETTVYQVEANLVSLSSEGDGSYTLLLGDDSGAKLRAIFPAPSCFAAGSDAAHAASAARATLRQACGDVVAGGEKQLRGKATLIGAGYWDAPYASGNGAELAPVLSFSYGGTGSCDATPDPNASPTPTPGIQHVYVGTDVTAVNAGAVVTVTASIVPARAGASCYTSIAPDPNVPKLTAANGTATWTFTLPATTRTGDFPITAYCDGHAATVVLRVHGTT